MNGLAICAGVSGLELALEQRIDGFKTVCFVEGELYSAANLVKKMEEGRFHPAPIWSNLCTFDGAPWRGTVHIISGGFPCQPHSTAGKRLGEEDPRNLWPHVRRVIGEIMPRLVFLENVSNINNTIAPELVRDLAKMGYSAAWCVITASSIGAPHKRARWFLLAHADSEGTSRLRVKSQQGPVFKRHFDAEGIESRRFENWWQVEPRVGRVVDGVADWVDRMRACGNGVVPQQAARAFDILAGVLEL